MKGELQKMGYDVIDEAIDSSDISKVRSIIRQELARVFFDLYRKRSVWGN